MRPVSRLRDLRWRAQASAHRPNRSAHYSRAAIGGVNSRVVVVGVRRGVAAAVAGGDAALAAAERSGGEAAVLREALRAMKLELEGVQSLLAQACAPNTRRE